MSTTESPTSIATTARLMYLIHQVRVATGDALGGQLADLELNGTQALIIESLDEVGEASAAELARRCLVSRQAVGAPLDQLEKRGLVERPESNANARMRPSRLTEAGRTMARLVRERVEAAEIRSTAIFDESELIAFRGMLERYASFWRELADEPARSPLKSD